MNTVSPIPSQTNLMMDAVESSRVTKPSINEDVVSALHSIGAQSIQTHQQAPDRPPVHFAGIHPESDTVPKDKARGGGPGGDSVAKDVGPNGDVTVGADDVVADPEKPRAGWYQQSIWMAVLTVALVAVVVCFCVYQRQTRAV